MTKAVFYIKDKVQDTGYRLFIIQKILNSNLEGTAINTSDGRIKVLLEGEKEKIIQFYDELKKEIPELSKNPTCSALEYDENLTIPSVIRSSQAHQLDQFGKAVVYLDSMNNKMETGFNRLETKLDQLPEKITAKLDTLPERIAKAMKA